MGCIAVKDSKTGLDRQKSLPGHRSSITNLIPTSKENIRNSYTFLKPLGEGGFGSVREVKHIDTSSFRAVKSISIKSMNKDQIDTILKEVQMLKQLDHPGIIKIYEVYTEENFIHIVTELCTGGDLFDKIARTQYFSENMAARYLFDIVSTIKYCHDNRIVHRDLKPENLLFEDKSNDARLKLIDFGTSVKFAKEQHLNTIIGTPFYIAPEVLDGNYNQLCDVWSIGVILYVMLIGKPPFKGKNYQEIFLNIKTKQLNFKGKI